MSPIYHASCSYPACASLQISQKDSSVQLKINAAHDFSPFLETKYVIVIIAIFPQHTSPRECKSRIAKYFISYWGGMNALHSSGYHLWNLHTSTAVPICDVGHYIALCKSHVTYMSLQILGGRRKVVSVHNINPLTILRLTTDIVVLPHR